MSLSSPSTLRRLPVTEAQTMAAAHPLLPQFRSETLLPPSSSISFVKSLSETPDLNSIPSIYAYTELNPSESFASSDPDEQDSIPVIDLSLLTTDDQQQRSQAILDLGRACEEWGFFMVVNHGVAETLMDAVIKLCDEFFGIPEQEKREYEGKHVLDPIRCGTSFNVSKDKILFWRDFLKVFVHPEFHSPKNPQNFRDVLQDYTQRMRELVKILLQGISESLGVEKGIMDKTLGLDSSLQIFVANYYPPCPKPELAMGMPPHSDHGLLTLLLQNQVGGLQIQHHGKWINVNPRPNSILVNTGDHLEIFSNGKYKSVLHRAVVNNKETRISVAIANGPSLEAIVEPASQLVKDQISTPAYAPMKYKEYLELQQSNQLVSKACLDHVRKPNN